MRLRVAVPVPHLDPLTYDMPDGWPIPPVGARVVVPLGGRMVTGVVCAIETDDASTGPLASAGVALAAVKSVREILDNDAFVPPDVMALAQWASRYYLAGLGDALASALPPGARAGRVHAHRMIRTAALTVEGQTLLRGEAPAERVRPTERRALEALDGVTEGAVVDRATLARQGVRGPVLVRLESRGLIALGTRRVERSPFEEASTDLPDGGPRLLTNEQAQATVSLIGFVTARTFKVALLHGVTGSGKSEIYVRLAAEVLRQRRRALVLVPEIGLTPAMTRLFRASFGDRVAIQHSGLGAGERHDQWHRIRRGDVDVIVGTRSAVFAPVVDLGLVVVDEEHDPSYKQDETPRYHGRDLAIVRGQYAGALVVLGSATPSLESYQHALSGKYALVQLTRRVMDRPLARVQIVDMREEYASQGPEVVLSRALRDGLLARVEAGEQSVVLLNRRGIATTVVCRQCAGTIDCPHCSVSLVVHGARGGRRVRCHYCDWSEEVPRTCPKCGGVYLELTGYGTERVEAELRALSPAVRVARVDRDAVGRKGALERLLKSFALREIDILVGTQMVAKGHDFPGVTLVGVVSADVGLGIADFRAAERTFQLLTQVVGRAGRGDLSGKAIVQTLYPEHYSIELACQQDYRAFAERELAFRREMRYPPFVALVNITVRAKSESDGWAQANELGALLRERRRAGRYEVLGPAPAPLGRLRNEHRVQLFLKGSDRRAMRLGIADVMSRRKATRSVTVDVDPVNLL